MYSVLGKSSRDFVLHKRVGHQKVVLMYKIKKKLTVSVSVAVVSKTI